MRAARPASIGAVQMLPSSRPDTAPPAPGAPAPSAGSWIVCHTMPRCEKKFAALLEAERIPFYLPLVNSVRHYGRQTKRHTKPLFPGYVFVDFAGPEKARLYQQDLLVRVIPVDDQRRLLRQLDEIRSILASGYELILHARLEKGVRVKVVAGPLMGLEGQIDNPTNPKGIVVSVDVLGQGVLVKIPFEDLQPTD